MKVAGVDGCRKGWLMVKWDGNSYGYLVFDNFSGLAESHPDLSLLLIDIPIGLSGPGFPRSLESALRNELKGRSSTVFNPPSREALYADNLESAKAINLEKEGKSISIQTWNIMPKIREVDEYLCKSKDMELYESHPELCFKYLNSGKVLMSSKKTAEGFEERFRILAETDPQLSEVLDEMLNSLPRSSVQKDDILDAACLALVAKLGMQNRLSFLEDKNPVNAMGHPMKIAFYRQ